MNWRRGVARLLIVLLAVVGVYAFLTPVKGGGSLVGLIIQFWVAFFLPGLIAYWIICLKRSIIYHFCRILSRGKSKAEKRETGLKKEFRILTLISAVIASLWFLVPLLIGESKWNEADYFPILAASLIVFVVSLAMVWLSYRIILFIGCLFWEEEDKKSEAGSERDEKDLKVEEI